MAGTMLEPSKTNHGEITLDLSTAAGPVVEERQGDDQEDSRRGRRKEGGKIRVGDVPSRRISPFTLLVIQRGIPFALASRTEFFFFCPFFFSRLRGAVLRMGGGERRGSATSNGPKWMAQSGSFVVRKEIGSPDGPKWTAHARWRCWRGSLAGRHWVPGERSRRPQMHGQERGTRGMG